jgi:gas vesicle protein GvpO/gas vesicle protein GvpG
MFVLDDLLLAPGKAAMFLVKELARKAQEEWLDDDSIKQELQELYTLFEGGRITDKDFEARECRLLERLEQIAKAKFHEKWGAADIDAQATVQPIETMLQAEAMAALPPAPPVIDVTPVALVAPVAPVAPAAPVASVTMPSVAAALSTAPVRPPRPPREVMPLLDDILAPLLQRASAASAPAPDAAVYQAPALPAPALQAPALPAPAPQAPALQAPGARLSIAQVIDHATQQLAVLKLRISTVSSVVPEDSGWRVTAELVERRGVPDTNDFLGVYDLRLDESGNVLRYERTHLRRRCDLGR